MSRARRSTMVFSGGFAPCPEASSSFVLEAAEELRRLCEGGDAQGGVCAFGEEAFEAEVAAAKVEDSEGVLGIAGIVIGDAGGAAGEGVSHGGVAGKGALRGIGGRDELPSLLPTMPRGLSRGRERGGFAGVEVAREGVQLADDLGGVGVGLRGALRGRCSGCGNTLLVGDAHGSGRFW